MASHKVREIVRTNAQIRAVDQMEVEEDLNGELVLTGYAALYNSESETLHSRDGEFVEILAPGSFDSVLATDPDVRFMSQHEGNALARTTNGTLRLWSDATGLGFEARLNPEASEARDLYALVNRGDLTQMSFAFTYGETSWIEDVEPQRLIVRRVASLFEISIVTFPAYSATTVEARSLDDAADICKIEEEPVAPATAGDSGDCDKASRSASRMIDSWSKRWNIYARSAESSSKRPKL